MLIRTYYKMAASKPTFQLSMNFNVIYKAIRLQLGTLTTVSVLSVS
jgi:hypothetical protein